MKRLLTYLALSLLLLPEAFSQEAGGHRTLTLQECIDLASSNNVNVKNSHLDYLAAKMQKREALANYFPVINASAMGFQAVNPLVRIGLNDLLGTSDAANNLKYYLGTTASLAGISTTYEALSNAFSAGLVLTQPICAGGRIVNGNRLAALGIEAATLQEGIARRDIGHEIESKYWTIISLEEKLEVIDKAIALADSLGKDAESARTAGLITDDESDLVTMKKQELKTQRIRLKGGIQLARMDLCEAMGISTLEARGLELVDRIPDLGEPQQYWKDPRTVAEGMEENKLLELAVRQKKLEKDMALGESMPQIGVGASYSYGQVIGSPQMNGTVFATVKIPITDWSKSANKMQRIEYQKQKAENEREHYSTMLELKVMQLWVEVESRWEELELKAENCAIALKAAERCEADFAAGLATASEVMDKQVKLSASRCEEIDARIAYRGALAEYLANVN